MNGLEEDPTTNANNIKAIVDAIRAVSAAIPIVLITPQHRDYSTALAYTIMTHRLMRKLYDLLSGYTSLYIVPLSLYHDSEYNYISGTAAVNPRSAITQSAVTDPIHPQDAGQYQFADAIFGVTSGCITS